MSEQFIIAIVAVGIFVVVGVALARASSRRRSTMLAGGVTSRPPPPPPPPPPRVNAAGGRPPPSPGTKTFSFIVTRFQGTEPQAGYHDTGGLTFTIRRAGPGAICRLSGIAVEACACGDHQP